MKVKTIVVNDMMQKGYRYSLAAPMGRDFDPDFAPELTPKEMLRLGVFGGKYMTDCTKEFPVDWFDGAKLSRRGHDPTLNYFGVSASQPLSVWRSKGWIAPVDPRGWFQWYCRYYLGRRIPEEDARQSGAGKRCGDMYGRSSATASTATSDADRANAKRCCSGPTTAGSCDGVAKRRPKPTV